MAPLGTQFLYKSEPLGNENPSLGTQNHNLNPRLHKLAKQNTFQLHV